MHDINIMRGNIKTSYDLIDKKKRIFHEFIDDKFFRSVEGKNLRGVISQASFYSSYIYNLTDEELKNLK